MRKNKERFQMQRNADEQVMRPLLEESVALGLFERAGTNKQCDMLYQIGLNAEALADVLRKLNGQPRRLQ